MGTGILNCGSRIMSEQGVSRFWDGNLTNCIRYFPTQAFNLAFKDTFKKMFPKYNPNTEFAKFFGANLVSGGLAAAGSMCIVYPLDYSRTRLASDVGSGKKTFSGLFDCMKKTAAGPGGAMALYTGFGVSVVGIVGYRITAWLFRHHRRPEPVEKGQGHHGCREHLRCRTNCHHHWCRCYISFRHRAPSSADAVGKASRRAP